MHHITSSWIIQHGREAKNEKRHQNVNSSEWLIISFALCQLTDLYHNLLFKAHYKA